MARAARNWRPACFFTGADYGPWKTLVGWHGNARGVLVYGGAGAGLRAVSDAPSHLILNVREVTLPVCFGKERGGGLTSLKTQGDVVKDNTPRTCISELLHAHNDVEALAEDFSRAVRMFQP